MGRISLQTDIKKGWEGTETFKTRDKVGRMSLQTNRYKGRDCTESIHIYKRMPSDKVSGLSLQTDREGT